jgi:hypothetical protein
MIVNKIEVISIPVGCMWCDFCVSSTPADKRIGSSDWICVAGVRGRSGKMDLGEVDVLKERPDWCMLSVESDGYDLDDPRLHDFNINKK